MKKLIAMLLAAGMLLSLTACSGGSSGDAGNTTAPAAPDASSASDAPSDGLTDGPAMNLVFASHLAIGSIENEALQRIIDTMSERTGGKITGAVYEAGTLGSEMEAIEQVLAGTCTLALTSYSSFDNYAPEYNTFAVPYLYTSADEVQASWEGPIGQAIQAAYEQNGLMFDHLMFRGNRQLTANKLITGPDELKGLKLRLPENEVSMAIWSGLGTLTYAIDSSEVFTALQLGTVDAQENPISSNYSKGLWEVQKYTIMTNHVVDFIGMVWSADWYNQLSDSYRALFDEACADACQWACEQEAAAEAGLRAEMEEKGMEFVEVDCSKFAEAAAPAVSQLAQNWADGVYEQAMQDIASVQ